MSTYKEIESRRNQVFDLVIRNRSIKVDELSSILKVSKMTVRRDLARLISRGMIQRVHGGASIRRTEENEPPFMIRSLEMRNEKKAIGIAAADLIPEKSVVIIDVGSTLLELVRNIKAETDVTIITNWLPIVMECSRLREFKVVVLGGEVNLNELSIVGGHSEEILDNYIADVFFMGVGGISTTFGITDFNMEEIRLKKHMMKSTKKVVVLADHSKFDRVGPRRVCDLSSVHMIVTDAGITDEQRRDIEKMGVPLLIGPSD